MDILELKNTVVQHRRDRISCHIALAIVPLLSQNVCDRLEAKRSSLNREDTCHVEDGRARRGKGPGHWLSPSTVRLDLLPSAVVASPLHAAKHISNGHLNEKKRKIK